MPNWIRYAENSRGGENVRDYARIPIFTAVWVVNFPTLYAPRISVCASKRIENNAGALRIMAYFPLDVEMLGRKMMGRRIWMRFVRYRTARGDSDYKRNYCIWTFGHSDNFLHGIWIIVACFSFCRRTWIGRNDTLRNHLPNM